MLNAYMVQLGVKNLLVLPSIVDCRPIKQKQTIIILNVFYKKFFVLVKISLPNCKISALGILRRDIFRKNAN